MLTTFADVRWVGFHPPAALCIENYTFKTSDLNEEVNCTESSPSACILSCDISQIATIPRVSPEVCDRKFSGQQPEVVVAVESVQLVDQLEQACANRLQLGALVTSRLGLTS